MARWRIEYWVRFSPSLQLDACKVLIATLSRWCAPETCYHFVRRRWVITTPSTLYLLISSHVKSISAFTLFRLKVTAITFYGIPMATMGVETIPPLRRRQSHFLCLLSFIWVFVPLFAICSEFSNILSTPRQCIPETVYWFVHLRFFIMIAPTLIVDDAHSS